MYACINLKGIYMSTPEFISVTPIDFAGETTCLTMLNVRHIIRLNQYSDLTEIVTLNDRFSVKETAEKILNRIELARLKGII